ncbi:MAG: YceI family protein [Alphaproteobacteria bacterium]|nr:YceI family protein [Alphaproteobacteria bacterium]
MTKRAGLWTPIACALFVLGASAPAQPLCITLDPAKTKIMWTLGDVLHTVHGTFQMKEGRFTFDPATDVISGEIVVDAASGDSGNNTRDKRMKRDILETGRYPDVRFVPRTLQGKVAENGTSTVQVTGIFTIHGQPHEITVPLTVTISGSNVSVKGTFVVPYVAWGMKNPSTFVLRVNQTVDIEVNASGATR